MAFRSTGYWKTVASQLRGKATYATSTPPKMQADLGHLLSRGKPGKKLLLKGDFVPVYVATGMVALSLSLGLYTVKQQVLYSPNVRVQKKMRETIPEVEEPEKVVEMADKFVKKSFFRKVAHILDSRYTPDPSRREIFVHQPRVETLKSVGVDLKQV